MSRSIAGQVPGAAVETVASASLSFGNGRGAAEGAAMRRMAIYSAVRLKREPEYERRYQYAHRFIQRMDGEDAQQDASEHRWGRPEALEVMGSGDDAVVGEVALVWLDRALARLTERERSVLKRHYGIGCEAQSHQKIAAADGLSKERIRQIEAKALRNLRSPWHCTDAEENSLLSEGCWRGFGWRPMRMPAWVAERRRQEGEKIDPTGRGVGAGPWREPEARKNLPEWLRRFCQQAFGETDDASGVGEGE